MDSPGPDPESRFEPGIVTTEQSCLLEPPEKPGFSELAEQCRVGA
jgi:hypothetical protein